MRIVDAHEDIATNTVISGRDIRRSALETRRLEQGSAVAQTDGLCMLGLPEWLAGRVALVVATIFAPPGNPQHPQPNTYTTPQEAHRLGQAQLDYYHWLAGESEHVSLVTDGPSLSAAWQSWETDHPQVGIVVLMEGADPIQTPAEVEAWYARGVRLVGLAWRSGSAYAGGDGRPGPLTDEGRELLEAMAELGMVLDVSHLAEEAFDEVLDRYEGRIVATHANPRARVDTPRQLSDRMIRRLAEREGVIGIVPFNAFLKAGWTKGDPKAAVTVATVAAAIDHVCQVVGDITCVGLGSDFDGGFGAESTPAEIDTVADLGRVGPALGELGYSTEQIEAVLGGNWLRVLQAALPA